MAKPTLQSRSRLAGFATEIGGISLREICDISIISIAKPLHDHALFDQNFIELFNQAPPLAPTSLRLKSPNCRVFQTQIDQWFVIGETNTIQDKFDYVTDQSDGWVALEISGENVILALERICPIDLHTDKFLIGHFARTMMEHMGCIILRTDTQTYQLFSASSSAESFLHAVETSIHNVT
ncbi:hypothetical protein BFP76_01895 [Amylibacter kogurei]|uniref:Sarcosine oxidase subunit gamma n=1 Tax=Paramylibacter kogurei TaxID=1889778 RepID=A0A2G5K3B1_9RHOB|nr:sarcosine oxidase subunit gamma family protein [Amylibacter kogurei]PIB24028.1 hypothetical protein BFP76_01895 [Amylibacter kogurei]